MIHETAPEPQKLVDTSKPNPKHFGRIYLEGKGHLKCEQMLSRPGSFHDTRHSGRECSQHCCDGWDLLRALASGLPLQDVQRRLPHGVECSSHSSQPSHLHQS